MHQIGRYRVYPEGRRWVIVHNGKTVGCCKTKVDAINEARKLNWALKQRVEPSNERLARAFNDSGVFKPFICIPKK